MPVFRALILWGSQNKWMRDRFPRYGFVRRVKSEFDNTGLCLQAYLYRTAGDIDALLEIRPNLRIVKGAYKEPRAVAYPKRQQVDANYFQLARILLPAIKDGQARVIFATHDERLLEQIILAARDFDLSAQKLEFNMLFGIKPSLRAKMVKRGFSVGVLISYGRAWFPWYMRRLAERPANVWFVVKNIFLR